MNTNPLIADYSPLIEQIRGELGLRSVHIRFRYSDDQTWRGECRAYHRDNVITRADIFINRFLCPTQKVWVLCHELRHAWQWVSGTRVWQGGVWSLWEGRTWQHAKLDSILYPYQPWEIDADRYAYDFCRRFVYRVGFLYPVTGNPAGT